MSINFLSSEFFRRFDEDDDINFYSAPRFYTHIDDIAIDKLSEFFRNLLPRDGVFLDLMSGWRSHLWKDICPIQVVGLGLNAEEMANNPQINSYIVHDLNHHPVLPFDEAEFDAVICSVSIQYLIKPVEVFCEVNRVLRTDGVFVIAFSNRYFSAKAIAVWKAITDKQRVQLIGHYFRTSGNWTQRKIKSFIPDASDPLYMVWANKL